MNKLSDDKVLLMKIDKLLLDKKGNVFIYNNALKKPLEQLRAEVILRLKASSKDVS